MKKYVGAKNAARTRVFLEKGIDKTKYAVKPSPVKGISKIVFKKGNDTTGYIMGKEVYTPKSRYDRSHPVAFFQNKTKSFF